MLDEARALVANRLGLDFPERRRDDLARGLLRAAQGHEPAAYLALLRARPPSEPEWRRLAGCLAVGESHFFRDPATFEALSRQVIPALIAERRARGVKRLRLWSAGCARGEEAYTLAMLVHRLLPDRSDWTLTILGTDIDPQALEAAHRGLYTAWSLRGLPHWARERFFRPREDRRSELAPAIRAMVTLAPLNLAGDAYPALATGTGAMDVILCRNVLMYFTEAARRATVGRLQRALVDGGWLVVSPAEASTELLQPLTPVTFGASMLHRKDASPRNESRPVCSPLLPPRPPADARRPTPIPAPGGELRRARIEADRGQLERAAELCRAALRADRLDAEAHLLLGAIHQERGDVDRALAAVRAAIYAAPDLAAAHFMLGSLLVRRGSTEQGRRCLLTASSLLDSLPGDEQMPGGDDITAAGLLDAVRAYLELTA